MRFITVAIILTSLIVIEAKTTKKPRKYDINKKSIKSLKPAIIAIEIVDPNENKTNSKNSKRTINNSLGYGYQNFFGARPPPPKYEVYKYSQEDIPAYRPPQYNYNTQFGGGYNNGELLSIQKSVSYRLPSQKYTNIQNYYQQPQPGTTLFSTLNSHGQLGGLTQQVPQQYLNEPQVPVIILRVLPSQLNDPSAVLHANLPSTHPLASTLNSINLQSLLNKYVQNVPQQATEDQGYHYPQPQSQLPQTQVRPVYENTYQPSYQYNQASSHSSQNLLTHENYPKNTHTRVIFRTDKPPVEEAKTIQITLPQSYQSVEVQTSEPEVSHQSQQYEKYSIDGNQDNYYYDTRQSGNYYQQPQGSNEAYNYGEESQQESKPHQQVSNYQSHQPIQQQSEGSYEQIRDVPQEYDYHNQKRRVRSKKGSSSTSSFRINVE